MSVEFHIDVPPPEFVGTDDEARELLRLSMRKLNEDPEDYIGFDTETHGMKIPIPKKPLDPINDTVTYWSLSFKTGDFYRRWCISQEYFRYFSPLLESPKLNIAGWNLKYDAHIAWNCGVNIWNARRPVDGLVLAQLFDENRRLHGLKSCAKDWCGLSMTKYKTLFEGILDSDGKKAQEYVTSLVELVELGHEDLVSNYASYDAYAHLRGVEWLIEKLKEIPLGPDSNLWDYFESMEMVITEVLWRMERRGMNINTEYLQSRIPIITGRINELERNINRAAGRPININSPKQLAAFFFTDDNGLRLDPVKLTATQQPSTDEEVMTALTEAGVEVAQLVVDCRKLHKSKSTYLDALITMSEYFDDGRIHPNFKQLGARTGRLSTENPNCVDGKTEVLTKSGWVRFDELETWDDAPDMVASLVAQWVPETGAIEFAQADLIEQHYTGKMIHVENQHIDLLMTPNHRCPLINRQTGELQVLAAKDYKEDKKQLHAGQYHREDSAGPMAEATHDQLAFILAVQADGSWHGGGIDFGFNKKKKADRFKAILENIGADFSYKEGGSAKYRFRVKAGPYVENAQYVLGDDKVFWDWITMMSSEQLEFFTEEIFFWDGCWDRKSMYASKHKKNADWVQLALTLCGKRAKVRKYKTPEGRADSWQVDATNRDYSMTTNVKRSQRSWDDTVYCVSVPSGFFIVRRNGKACITGNSQNFPRPDGDEWGIRKAFIPAPGHKLIVADYCQIEMRIMADFADDELMMGAILDGKDLHSYTVALTTPGVEYEEVVAAKKSKKPDDRQKWLLGLRQDKKKVGFGIIYGAGPPKISTEIDITDEEWQAKLDEMPDKTFERRVTRLMGRNPLLTEDQAVEQVGRHSVAGDKISEYFDAFPGVKRFMDHTPIMCRHMMYYDENNQSRTWDFQIRTPGAIPTSESGHSKPFGYVQTLCGRYRRLEDIDHKNYFYKSEAERQCVNTRIQGSAADITKAAMLRIELHHELNMMGVCILNQVHDEIVMEVPEEYAEIATPIIQHCMEHPFGDEPENAALRVPIPVEIVICSNWAQAK